LAGVETKLTGAVRIFRTKQLSAGQKWSDYVVRVESERNGELETREQTIDLLAGEDRELKFDFTDKVAEAR
ncbi:MAG: TIGR03000 domain-containing protein, partial [Pirellulaceae bacterium]|jgi:uncharacterized protein (TIGR03000 family)|nr:TIGR03000 domain-containing protein [Pirellulaceae bacterium]